MNSKHLTSKPFEGRTAWFAINVTQRQKHLWFSNGGQVETLNRADYIFSESFSNDIAMNRIGGGKYPIAIFHPKFIDVCVREGCLDRVPAGWFHVIPEELVAIVSERFPQGGSCPMSSVFVNTKAT